MKRRRLSVEMTVFLVIFFLYAVLIQAMSRAPQQIEAKRQAAIAEAINQDNLEFNKRLAVLEGDLQKYGPSGSLNRMPLGLDDRNEVHEVQAVEAKPNGIQNDPEMRKADLNLKEHMASLLADKQKYGLDDQNQVAWQREAPDCFATERMMTVMEYFSLVAAMVAVRPLMWWLYL